MSRKSLYFDTEQQALKGRREILAGMADVQAMTLEGAIGAYAKHLETRNLKDSTVQDARGKLRPLLRHVPKGALVEDVTRRTVEQRLGTQKSVYGRRMTLRVLREFFAHAIKQGWTVVDPCARVVVEGRAERGKAQLTLEEAARLAEHLADDHSHSATAILLSLMCGFRSGEIRGLRCKDVAFADNGTAIVQITSGKTHNAVRSQRVPPTLAQRLKAARGDRDLQEPLLKSAYSKSGVYGRHWLVDATRTACEAAKVAVVTPHGLRGTHSTLATMEGSTASVVANALGHGSDEVTRRHYIAKGAVEQAKADNVVELLEHREKEKEAVS